MRAEMGPVDGSGSVASRLILARDRGQVLGFLVHLVVQVQVDLLTLAARSVELIEDRLAVTQILLVRIQEREWASCAAGE